MVVPLEGVRRHSEGRRHSPARDGKKDPRRRSVSSRRPGSACSWLRRCSAAAATKSSIWPRRTSGA